MVLDTLQKYYTSLRLMLQICLVTVRACSCAHEQFNFMGQQHEFLLTHTWSAPMFA